MVSSRPLALDNKHVNIIIKICVIKLGELIKKKKIDKNGYVAYGYIRNEI
jgi:hypothetical protein